MADIFVPPSNPQAFDERFCKAYPALGMKATSGSGSVHGDGDGRPTVIDYSKLQFAMEGKCRSGSPQHCRPTPNEWRKAQKDLHVRNAGAVRLFAVYQFDDKNFKVSIPKEDYEQLCAILAEKSITVDAGYQEKEVADDTMYLHDYLQWKSLYASIERFRESE